MSFTELMNSYIGSSGDPELDFVVYALFALFLVKLLLGAIREVFKY